MAKKVEKKKSSAGAAIFCIVAAVLAFQASGNNGVHSAGSNSANSLSCRNLEKLWEDNGGSASTAFMAAEIAMAESNGDQYSTDYDSDGTVDRGYWQINSVHGALSTYDANGNASAAVQLSSDGTDWTPWVTYNNNKYEGQCLCCIVILVLIKKDGPLL